MWRILKFLALGIGIDIGLFYAIATLFYSAFWGFFPASILLLPIAHQPNALFSNLYVFGLLFIPIIFIPFFIFKAKGYSPLKSFLLSFSSLSLATILFLGSATIKENISRINDKKAAEQDLARLTSLRDSSEISASPWYTSQRDKSNTNFAEYYFDINVPMNIKTSFDPIDLYSIYEIIFSSQKPSVWPPQLKGCAHFGGAFQPSYIDPTRQPPGRYVLNFRYSYYENGHSGTCTKDELQSLIGEQIEVVDIMNTNKPKVLKTFKIDSIQ